MPSIKEVLPILVERIDNQDDLGRREPFINGIETDIESLDKAVLGFHRGDLIVLVSEPGAGKTTMAIQLAAHILIDKERSIAANLLSEKSRSVAFITWRNSLLDIAMSVIAYGMEKPVREVSVAQFGDKDWECLTYSLGIFVESDLQIESIQPDIVELENVLENPQTPRMYPLGLVVIDDCWGYCDDPISAFRFLRWLKSWAMKKQVPILLTAGVRQLEGKDPVWCHLKEFSDLTLLLETEDGVSLKVVKQGRGSPERIMLSFNPSYLFS